MSSKTITADADVLSTAVPIGEYPVYVRKGACLPLQKSPEDESVLFTWFGPDLGTSSSAQVREPWESHPGIGTGMIGTVDLSATGDFTASITANKGGAGY